jgi:hypothetical protein
MGVVEVEMDGTSCRVPSAVEYIGKVKAKGNVGKKRKMLKCCGASARASELCCDLKTSALLSSVPTFSGSTPWTPRA